MGGYLDTLIFGVRNILSGGSPLPLRSDLNFIGATVADNPATGATDVTVGAGGSGDVVGPIVAVDNALARFDGATGKLIQNSGTTLSDAGELRVPGTFQPSKGADIASAATLTLGTDGNYFDVTGTAVITAISAKSIGTPITLHFDAAATLTHNAVTLKLSGGVDFVAAAGDHIILVCYDGTNWREVSRLLAVGGVGDVTTTALTTNVMTVGGATAKSVKDAPSAWADNGAGTISRTGAAVFQGSTTARVHAAGGEARVSSATSSVDLESATRRFLFQNELNNTLLDFNLPLGGAHVITSEATASSVEHRSTAQWAVVTTGANDIIFNSGSDVDIRHAVGRSIFMREGAANGLTLNIRPTGPQTITSAAGCTSVTISQAQHASAGGNPTTIAAQDAASGAFAGGKFIAAAGEPGDATVAGGGIDLDVGTGVVATGATAPLRLMAGATIMGGFTYTAALDLTLDTWTLGGSAVRLQGSTGGFTSLSSNLILVSANNNLYLDSGNGVWTNRDGATVRTTTMVYQGAQSVVHDDKHTTWRTHTWTGAKTTDALPSGWSWTGQDAYASATGANRVGGGFTYNLGAGVSDGSYGDPAIEDGIITTTVNSTNARREMVFRCTGTVTFSITPPGDGTFLYEIRYLTNDGAVIQRISAQMTTAGELTAIDTFANAFGSIPVGAGSVATVDTTNDVLDIDVSDTGDGGGGSDRKWTVWVRETRMGDNPTA